jgi:hypothetical protein
MYILTDYRLILKKDRPDLSSERAHTEQDCAGEAQQQQ